MTLCIIKYTTIVQSLLLEGGSGCQVVKQCAVRSSQVARSGCEKVSQVARNFSQVAKNFVRLRGQVAINFSQVAKNFVRLRGQVAKHLIVRLLVARAWWG